jgi:hypothetical protein
MHALIKQYQLAMRGWAKDDAKWRLPAQLDDWLDYDFPTDIRSGMTGSWLRYRGQTQKWCALWQMILDRSGCAALLTSIHGIMQMLAACHGDGALT